MSDHAWYFEGLLEPAPNGGAYVRLPFDPAEVWGDRERYHVTGKLAGFGVRGPLAQLEGGFALEVGPAWLRDCPLQTDTRVNVTLRPEGAQLQDLDEDVAAALRADPDAERFFESLAQFYRKACLKWLDGARRRPEVRRQRLGEFVALLKAGHKSRS
jgi:hypothetical protein